MRRVRRRHADQTTSAVSQSFFYWLLATTVASGSSQLRKPLHAIEADDSFIGFVRRRRRRRRSLFINARGTKPRDLSASVSDLAFLISSSREARRESRRSVHVPRDLAIPPLEVTDRATPAQDRDRRELAFPREEDDEEDARRSRDYEQASSLQKRSPLLEEAIGRHEEGSPFRKEHSLEYQSQTLESQSDRRLHEATDSSLEDLLKSTPDSWTQEVYEEESLDEVEVELSFKETQFSPKEKRDVQTQTVQESKSTQCSPDQSVTSPCEEPPRISPFHVGQKYFQSPKREVQTQTQGENKSVQCSLDDLGDLASWKSDLSARSDQQESKSIQCVPEDISGQSLDRSGSSSRASLRSPRREVEVQTYQESKAIQCSDDELLEADLESADRTQPGPQQQQSRPTSSTSRKTTESSPSSGSSSPRKLPTVVFVEGRGDMTVTHREHDGDVTTWSKNWGPERLVEVYREPKTSLGLSIVGGKVRCTKHS